MMINVLYTPGLSVHACLRMIRRHIEERNMMDLETVPQVKRLRKLDCLSWDTIVTFKNLNNCLLKNVLCILFLAVLGLCCCVGFSLVVASRDYSVVAVHRLLTAVASLLAKHRLPCI